MFRFHTPSKSSHIVPQQTRRLLLSTSSSPISVCSISFNSSSNSSSSSAVHKPQHHQSRDKLLDRLRQATARGFRSNKDFVKSLVIKNDDSVLRDQETGAISKQQLPQQPPSLREQMILMKQRHRKKMTPEAILKKKSKCRTFNKLVNIPCYFKEEDLTENSILGRGPGGQATNRRRQTCQLKHLPTGICVRFSKFRSLYSNRKAARMLLSSRLEMMMFGKHSKLGEQNIQLERKRKRREQIRSKLLRMVKKREERRIDKRRSNINNNNINSNNGSNTDNMNEEETHKNINMSQEEEQQQEQHSNVVKNSLFGKVRFPFHKLLMNTQINNKADNDSTSNNSWMKQLTFQCQESCITQNNSSTKEDNSFSFSSCCWNENPTLSSISEHPPTCRFDFFEDSCFFSNPTSCWWSMLEFCWNEMIDGNSSSQNHHQHHGNISREEVSEETNNNSNDSNNPYQKLRQLPPKILPPHFFLVLFPVFPSSPLLAQPHKVCSAPTNWEGRERSYIMNNSTCLNNLKKSFSLFFEMFGLRLISSSSSSPSSSSSCHKNNMKIERDIGLNWIEGRMKLTSYPEMSVVLFEHVLTCAIEFEFHEIVEAMKEFLEDAIKNERHEETRKVFQHIWKSCEWCFLK